MGVVYIAQDVPNLNFEPALKFGEQLVAVFPPGQVRLSTQAALGNARKVLKDITLQDWLVLAGDPVMIGICCAVVAHDLGILRVLRWDRHEMKYIPIEINMIDVVV